MSQGAARIQADGPGPGPPARAPAAAARLAPRRARADRIAAGVVRSGGVLVVASLLGIVVFLFYEAVPLLFDADLLVHDPVVVPGQALPTAVLVDEHRTHLALLAKDGRIRGLRLADGSAVSDEPFAPARSFLAAKRVRGESAFAALASDGRIGLRDVAFPVQFDGRTRVVEPRILAPTWTSIGADAQPPFAIRENDGRTVGAALRPDGQIAVTVVEVEVNDFTGERTRSSRAFAIPAPVPPVDLVDLIVGPELGSLYGWAGASLWVWSLDAHRASEPEKLEAAAPITSVEFLLGGRALALGREDGVTAVWFRVPVGGAGSELRRIRELPPLDGPVRAIATSSRNRSFLAQSATGDAALYHSTSERTLWRGHLGGSGALVLAPKGDGGYLAETRGYTAFELQSPHPEAGVGAFFGKVWYEDYPQPGWVWQSTGGTDEFEPKLSLVPLLVGTLKGTAYALLLSIPLGILGAMYTSQFIDPRLARIVKPTLEIMASLPSVVLGFLAGLWLAPRLESAMPGLILMVGVLPAASIAIGAAWNALPRRYTGRLFDGAEVLAFTVVLAIAIWGCLAASPMMEAAFFGGSFSAWLFESTGLPYDQRNAIVAGIAMGFAVIPIVFAIAEDALSNVPRTLTAGSLALGASRWQTVSRIVLPAAAPGLFAAAMIGLGRAVGETMIVLMATGNTPLLEWNAFNGFRTLSANIAVEIPEAPHGGTLYRTLFVSALVLFVITFFVNTAAEVVRDRLRRKYAAL